MHATVSADALLGCALSGFGQRPDELLVNRVSLTRRLWHGPIKGTFDRSAAKTKDSKAGP